MTEQTTCSGDTPDVVIEYYDAECQKPYRRIRHDGQTWSGDENIRTVRQWFVGDDGLTSIERERDALATKLQHRAKQTLEMDECIRALSATIDVIKKVYPEVQGMFDAADQIKRLAKDLGYLLPEDKA